MADAPKLVQLYCTNCGETKTYAEGDKKLSVKVCKTCLQGEMLPVVAPIATGGTASV